MEAEPLPPGNEDPLWAEFLKSSRDEGGIELVDQEQQPPSYLDLLIDGAYRKFNDQRRVEFETGEIRAFDIFDAAEDTLVQTGFDPYFLFGIIYDLSDKKDLHEILTYEDPELKLSDFDNPMNLFNVLNINYVTIHLVEKYPDALEEEQRRMDEDEGSEGNTT